MPVDPILLDIVRGHIGVPHTLLWRVVGPGDNLNKEHGTRLRGA